MLTWGWRELELRLQVVTWSYSGLETTSNTVLPFTSSSSYLSKGERMCWDKGCLSRLRSEQNIDVT